MTVRGIIFDVYGTLTDIRTDEWYDDVYRVISKLLSYQGIVLDPSVVKFLYSQGVKNQRAACVDRYPEYDVVKVFREIVAQHATDFTRALPVDKLEQLPAFLAETHRAASRFLLQRYPGVEETIRHLHQRYRLAIVSDSQKISGLAELNAVGLSGYFDPIVLSGDFGYRKPDKRLFSAALSAMKMNASEVLYVGNDMYRDVYGAQRVGIKTVFFKSNQGTQEKDGVRPDYIIYNFPELLNAVRFFEEQ